MHCFSAWYIAKNFIVSDTPQFVYLVHWKGLSDCTYMPVLNVSTVYPRDFSDICKGKRQLKQAKNRSTDTRFSYISFSALVG